MDKEKQVIFGIHPILEKLRASPDDITEIIVAKGPARLASRSVGAAARKLGVRVNYADPAVLDRLAMGQRHQGVVAQINAFAYLQISQLLQSISSLSGSGEILILDGLTDPRNFGALLRTAEAVGIQHVVIPKDRSVDVTPTVVRTSAGAVHYLKIYKATNLRQSITSLKDHGFWFAGLDVHATTRIYDRVLPEKLGIVLGSEGEGIRPLIRRECDFLVSIPMIGQISSLNVGVAGAVFLYEVFRQKHSVDRVGAKRY